jgi:hypothetical protein
MNGNLRPIAIIAEMGKQYALQQLATNLGDQFACLIV